MSQRLTIEELNGLINRQVADVLTGDQMYDLIRENIAKSLEPLQKSNEDFRKDVLGTINKGFKSQDPATKGQLVGRILRALAATKCDPERAARFATKQWGDDTVAKALSSSEAGDGGFLLRDDIAAEVIELLRPASVVRSLNPVMVPMDTGTLRMPKHTAGSAGGWIGENTNAPATQPGFGQVVLTAKKYASLVPISNDLIRRASPMADQLVRDDLVADIATSTDVAYIRSPGSAATPKGLRYQAAAANILTMTGTGLLAEVTADLGRMIQTLGDGNVRMLRLGWIMEWRTWRALITARDGNGNLVFKPEMDRGTLFGFPFRITSQIPRTLGGGTETELYLADFADVLVGETTGILIDTSGEAAYHDGSNVVAAFSLDQTVIRAIVEVDLAVRHPEAVVVLTGVTWSLIELS